MPTEVLFWYTGWVIWALIALAIFIITLAVAICATCKAWYYCQNWIRLYSMLDDQKHTRITTAYRHACRDVGVPFKDNQDKMTAWLFSMAKRYRELDGAGDSESNPSDQGAGLPGSAESRC